MSALQDALEYRNLMYTLGLGYALYNPAPVECDHIRVGDVGYIEGGYFVRLFNACFEANDQANKDCDLYESYKPLESKFRKVLQPFGLDKGIRVTKHLSVTRVTGEAIAPGSGGPIPIAGGGRFVFKCREKSGAMLTIIKHAVVWNAKFQGAFGRWMMAHSNALRQFALDHDKKLSDIILVTECCLSRDWTLNVTRSSSNSAEFSLHLGVLDGGAEATIAGEEIHQVLVPPHNWKVNAFRQPSTVGKPEPDNDTIYTDVERKEGVIRDQCIFLRGYRVEQRDPLGVLGLTLKAAAGPNELPQNRPPSPATGVTASDGASEPMILDDSESLNFPKDQDNLIQRLFEHIFQHSEADVAVLHDDVICRVAADGWSLDNLMAHLDEHEAAHQEDVATPLPLRGTGEGSMIVDASDAMTAASRTTRFGRSENTTLFGEPYAGPLNKSPLGPNDIISLIDKRVWTFQEFSLRVLSGQIRDGGAKLLVLERHKEEGTLQHRFIMLQVAVGEEKFWLRLEGTPEPIVPLSLRSISSTSATSGLVRLAKEASDLIPRYPKCMKRSTALFALDDTRTPTLKDLAYLLKAVAEHPPENPSKSDWGKRPVIAAILERALTDTDEYTYSFSGKRSKWATKSQTKAAGEAMLRAWKNLKNDGVLASQDATATSAKNPNTEMRGFPATTGVGVLS